MRKTEKSLGDVTGALILLTVLSRMVPVVVTYLRENGRQDTGTGAARVVFRVAGASAGGF